ncbi:hypothetical protein DXG01_001689, partial [Tephrocybe rancida]
IFEGGMPGDKEEDLDVNLGKVGDNMGGYLSRASKSDTAEDKGLDSDLDLSDDPDAASMGNDSTDELYINVDDKE